MPDIPTYPTHACLSNLSCNLTDAGFSTNDMKTMTDIIAKMNQLKTDSMTTSYNAAYALKDYQNAIRIKRESMDNDLANIHGAPDSTAGSYNAKYEVAMLSGIMWATLGTLVVYYVFTRLDKK